MAIKFDTFSSGGGGSSSDTLDDVTGRGSSTTNSLTVGGLAIGSAYSLPTSDGGVSNRYLKTDGAGNLSFANLDVTGGLEYKGSYTGQSLVTAKKGDFYVVVGSQTLAGVSLSENDHIVFNTDASNPVVSTEFDVIDNTERTDVLIKTNNLNDLDNDATARTNLGVAIGTDVQAYDAQLSEIAALATTDGGFIVGNGSSFVLESGATARTSLGLETVASTGAYNDLTGKPTLGTAAAVDTGTSAGEVVIMEDVGGVSKLPAVDGSQLINLPSGSLFTTTTTTSATYDASVNEIINLSANTGGEIRVNLPSSASSGDIIILRKPSNIGGSSADPVGQGTMIAIYDSGGTKLKELQLYPVLGSHILSYDGSNWSFPVTNIRYQQSLSNNYTLYAYRFGKDIVYADNADSTAFTVAIQGSASDLLEGASQKVFCRGERSVTITSQSSDIVDPSSNNSAEVLTNSVTVAVHSSIVEIWVNSQSQFMINAPLANLGTAAFADIGTTANKIVQLTSLGKLPQVDGSLLQNIVSTDSTKLAKTNNLNDLDNDATARTNLGVAIGTDVQAYDAQLSEIAALATTDGGFIVGNGSSFVLESGATARTSLGLETVASTGAYDDLTGKPTLGTASASATTDFLSATGADSLGGDLDTNDHEIVSSSNKNVTLRPNGTGIVKLGGNTNPAELRFYCETTDQHYVGIKAPTHAELQGKSSISWRLPIEDASTSGEALVSDGSGNLSFTTISGGGNAPTVTTDSSGSDTTISTNTGIEEIHLINNTNNNVTITIPGGISAGYKYNIKRLGSGTVTLQASSGTIDTATNFSLASQFDSVTVVSDGTNYHII